MTWTRTDGTKRAATHGRRIIGTGLLALLALVTWGCPGARRVEQVRTCVYPGQSITLDAAYAKLLESPHWETVAFEPERYVKVSGKLRQDGGAFEAYYAWNGMPPQVAFFTARGKRGSAAEFPAFLRNTLLKQALAAP